MLFVVCVVLRLCVVTVVGDGAFRQETRAWYVESLAGPVRQKTVVGSEVDVAQAIEGLDEDTRKKTLI